MPKEMNGKQVAELVDTLMNNMNPDYDIDLFVN
jgi:hypothetical protein